jgi:diguanylate cyclase (GGDEF)-like protein
MYGITKEYFHSHFHELSPERQPDGSISRDKQLEIMKQTLNGEKVILEWMHCTPTGTPIPCEITLARTKQGETYIGLVYVYDLRRVKHMEMALSEAEELTRNVMDASPIAYILFDKNYNPLDCNNAALLIFECPDKQYFLDHYWDYFLPAYQPDGMKSFEKALAMRDQAFSKGRCVFEWVYTSNSKEQIPVEKTMTPLMYNGERLMVSFEYDLRNIKKMEDNIRWLEIEVEKIYFDALTGIYNRRYFDECFNRLTKTLSRSGGILSLIMIDIDFFKAYNDIYGHTEGDKCLKIIAEALAGTIERSDDFAARYGGEEFVVVLPNTNESGARMMAEKLLENIRNRRIPHRKSDAASFVTVSIGVTTGAMSHTQSADDYVKRADEMLYVSKHSGRNRYSFAAL